jgi:hypothetical protein
LPLAQSKEAKPMIKASTAIAFENIGSVGAMRERDYFQAPQPPFCRLESVLFDTTRLAQLCR